MDDFLRGLSAPFQWVLHVAGYWVGLALGLLLLLFVIAVPAHIYGLFKGRTGAKETRQQSRGAPR